MFTVIWVLLCKLIWPARGVWLAWSISRISWFQLWRIFRRFQMMIWYSKSMRIGILMQVRLMGWGIRFWSLVKRHLSWEVSWWFSRIPSTKGIENRLPWMMFRAWQLIKGLESQGRMLREDLCVVFKVVRKHIQVRIL